ncbi:OmpH family outer membrane protein [bacterium]|nr:MAG: OmpH family outer membrane protein [bacterium]
MNHEPRSFSSRLGWILFAALLGGVSASGFQEAAQKNAVVDITKVVEQSDYGKQNRTMFAQMQQAREDLLEFIDNNRVITTEQAISLRDLTIKPQPSQEDQNRMTTLKAEIVATNKRWNELATKATLTPEERTLLQEYATRSQAMSDFAVRLLNQFRNEMSAWADKQREGLVEKARTAIQEVAKAQGYNMVFEVGVAPYGANDITGDALKAMNTPKPAG